MSQTQRDRFRIAISSVIGVAPESVTLFAKGRVALHSILTGLGVGEGDEVILPAFTCVAVPNAVLYTGARPVFVDIDPVTYTIDPEAAAAAITPKTRILLAQNTFGLSSDLDALEAVASPRGVTVIDDCTHGLGGRYGERSNGSIAAASFFSTQWSKTVSTGLGGFAVARDHDLAARMRAIEDAAREPSALYVGVLKGLLFGLEHGGHGRMFRSGRSLYRALGRHGVVPSSSSSTELEGTVMPNGFLTRLSQTQAGDGVVRIGRLMEQVARRRAIARRYTDWLVSAGKVAVSEPDGVNHTYLRYAIRVEDRQSFLAAADRSGIDIGDWFVSPIHPVIERLDRWGYEAGSAPVAEAATREIVNLPTHPSMEESDVEAVLDLLGDRLRTIR